MITSLKKATAGPDHVQAFRLSGRFESLPDDMCRFRSLEVLILKGSALSSLPPWKADFEHLSSLVMVNQDRDILTSGGFEGLTRLQSLRELEVSMISGVMLPEAIAHLASLERLSLTFCDLETCPAALGSLERLRVLDRTRTPSQ